MNKASINNFLFIGALALLLLPGAVFAQAANTAPATISVPQGFNGIFSCNQNGSYAMSVGALGATGGVYVPVADASVELNTGTLVYKECVLREVVDAQRQAATAGFLSQANSQIQTGRNGSPQYVVSPVQDKVSAQNAIAIDDLQNNGTFNTVNSSFKGAVTQALAHNYVTLTQQINSQLTCPYQGDIQSLDTGQSFSLDGLAALENPACNQEGVTLLANVIFSDDLAQGSSILDQEWLWGQGYYPITTGGANPLTQQIVTPSSLVNSSFTQIVTSPFNQLQNANDLGQMVGALFAGISTQITSPNGGGLAGLSQPIGSQPSYLAQAVAQTTQNLQQNISNAALANLSAALQIEQTYYSIMNTIAGSLTSSISSLRSAENQCWQQIINKVCTSAPAANGTCQDSAGDNLKVATSTAFSQTVISSQIAGLASTTANNLIVSQKALNLINQLIQGVTSAGADSQSVAIAQLNQLIQNHQLHTQPDVTTAQTQGSSVETAMTTLVQNTVSLWAGTDPNNSTNTNISWDGSVSPGTGWCNFQNPTTLQMWEQLWKQ